MAVTRIGRRMSPDQWIHYNRLAILFPYRRQHLALDSASRSNPRSAVSNICHRLTVNGLSPSSLSGGSSSLLKKLSSGLIVQMKHIHCRTAEDYKKRYYLFLLYTRFSILKQYSTKVEYNIHGVSSTSKLESNNDIIIIVFQPSL